MNGISFAESLCQGSEKVCELVVAVDIGRVFLHGILHRQYSRVFAGLGVQHTHTVRFLRWEIDVLKDSLALAARTERIDRQGHTRAQSDKT